ncbi:MAG TPA: cyclopropane-fatty-acyl-phospholipid synthase family protein, partial [Caulifigura sp.]|nr:cyclopropane-fatty-acyl-phospholipid synthase family protein [Caulifigura sp.]
DFLELFNRNRTSLGTYPLQKALRRVSRGLRKVQQYNPMGKAQKNVAHHYDQSAEMYALFLDADQQDSGAYFPTGAETLEEAQLLKKQHIAAKLCLKPGQRVLDIGCGWGGMALSIASMFDVEVLGVTLSTEQLQVATARAKKMGLDHRVKFELRDYRELTERFDRIVSVGMFEHVGVAHFDEFFEQTGKLLKDDGVMLLHAIGRMSPPGTTGPWIRKYIFPGGYTPAMSEVFAATERQRLWVTDMEVLRLHYADTLKHWAARFAANRARVAELYDERFCRMWEFYLACAEMAFRQGSSMVFQMQLTRDRAAVPATRDYMVDVERSLIAQGQSARRAA